MRLREEALRYETRCALCPAAAAWTLRPGPLLLRVQVWMLAPDGPGVEAVRLEIPSTWGDAVWCMKAPRECPPGAGVFLPALLVIGIVAALILLTIAVRLARGRGREQFAAGTIDFGNPPSPRPTRLHINPGLLPSDPRAALRCLATSNQPGSGDSVVWRLGWHLGNPGGADGAWRLALGQDLRALATRLGDEGPQGSDRRGGTA